MKNTKNNKNITCRIVSTGTIMHVNTIDEILSPGHYKIDACGVTVHDGFPDGLDGECLSAYLEVSDTNHSNDNLKSAAVGQTLSCTNASGVTAAYYRSAITKNGLVKWNSWVDLGAATTTDIQDGSITAEKLSKDVRTKIDNPWRPLFIAAGAEYNNTGVDKTKTAPWGGTVTHKAGCYYLNGLGNITEEQMMAIYNAPHNALYEQAYASLRVPTFLFSGSSPTAGLTTSPNGLFISCKELEVIAGNGVLYFAPSCGTLKNLFRGCNNLRHICLGSFYGKYVKFENTVFQGCTSLETIKIIQLQDNLFLSDSPSVSKESLLFIIANSAATSAITITLHPNAYSRLANDSDIVAALNAQPTVLLASA